MVIINVDIDTFLFALVGHMSPIKSYSLNGVAWSRAVLQLRKKYEERYPELFYGLQVRVTESSTPYSSQVVGVLVWMDISGSYIPVHNDSRNPQGLMELIPDAQDVMLELAKQRHILPEYGEALNQMAKELEDSLAI